MTGSTVLWVGGSPQDGSWHKLLCASGLKVVTARDLEDAQPLLQHGSPDIVLLDAHGRGADLASRVASIVSWAGPAAKILAIVPRAEAHAAALMAGAHDAVHAGADADDVRVRVLAWVRVAAHDRQQQRTLSVLADRVLDLEQRLGEALRENRELRELAHRDELTGLGNRRSFRTSLDFAVEFAARYGGQVSVILVDLDGMKALNDGQGHPAGDAALRHVADVMRSALRVVDHAARLGGDEFGVVMPSTPADAAALVAERIRGAIEALPLPGGVRLSASLGVATCVAPRGVGFAADEVTARADAALYAAKRAGKNRVEVDGAKAARAA